MKNNHNDASLASYRNSLELLEEANLLYNSSKFPRAYALAILSLEEFAKSFLYKCISTNLIKDEEFDKDLRIHDEKIFHAVHLIASYTFLKNFVESNYDPLTDNAEPDHSKHQFPKVMIDSMTRSLPEIDQIIGTLKNANQLKKNAIYVELKNSLSIPEKAITEKECKKFLGLIKPVISGFDHILNLNENDFKKFVHWLDPQIFSGTIKSDVSRHNDPVESALNHIKDELLLSRIKDSLKTNFTKAQQAHDSIHEHMLSTSILVPREETEYSIKKNIVYFLYCWELFDLAHRSSLDALSTYYNAAHTLLRSVLEILIKGTFLDCLAHKKFRENSDILNENKRSKRIRDFVEQIISKSPQSEKELENNTVSILDELETFANVPNNMPTFSIMIKQLIEWHLLDGIDNPYDVISEIYRKLSFDVHAHPDYMDIGRVLLSDLTPFQEREVIPKHLLEYFSVLHTIMDIAIVVALNLLKENIFRFPAVKERLIQRKNTSQFLSLDLKNTVKRLNEILK